MTSENIIQGNTIKPTLKSPNKRCPVPAHTPGYSELSGPRARLRVGGGQLRAGSDFHLFEADPTVDTLSCHSPGCSVHAQINLSRFLQ